MRISDNFTTFVSMSEQVTDMLTAFESLSNEISSMRKQIDDMHSTICNQSRTIQAQNKTIANLRKKLSKYEDPSKNSENSSTPPSKESIKDEIIRRTNTIRKKSGKPVGGQSGHKGTKLNMTEIVDEEQEIDPNYCTQCGESLEESERILDYTAQIISIPELKAVVRNVNHYIRICRHCGARVQSHEKRRRGGNDVVYDNTVKSLVVYLSVVGFLTFGRIDKFFREVFGMKISQGSMVNWIEEAKSKAQPVINEIMERIKDCTIVGFDESGLYCNKKLNWAWIAQTLYFTILFRADGRGGKELESRFGDSLKRMIAVTDRHSAYFALNFLNHQVCIAHLLRNLQYLDELDKEQTWSVELGKMLKDSIHQRNEHPSQSIDKQPWLDKLDKLLKQNIEKLKDEYRIMRDGLIKCRNYMFNFLENPHIPSDNNASERGIRKLKIKMKNACTFRSEWGADAFLELHSIVETAKKHTQTSYKAIRSLFGLTDSHDMQLAE